MAYANMDSVKFKDRIKFLVKLGYKNLILFWLKINEICVTLSEMSTVNTAHILLRRL